MKKLIVAVVASLTVSGQLLPNIAATQTAPTKKSAAAPALSTAQFDKQLAQVQEQMKTMQAQMDQIRQTQDPQERQRLMQQALGHDAERHERDARSLWGPGMMRGGGGCCGGGWGHMRSYYSNLTPEQLRQRQYMTDQYLNMQQMMNNMMWDQQHWTGRQHQQSRCLGWPFAPAIVHSMCGAADRYLVRDSGQSPRFRCWRVAWCKPTHY
ncbi:hypothetical protein SAMN03159335_04095 [Burkholderia cepacia]|uniref:hypothetical protein n=1 Tax=Burkholderia cepacia TaxID=292 RepID=UPI0008D468A3|nr:hypothetical protein SAMN03159335_04095 [Burkholderia cepacia]